MNQQILREKFESYLDFEEPTDTYDTYREDYAQELLDDDALELAEVAFLKGYRDDQF